MHEGGPSAGHYYAYVRQKAPNATSASAVRWVKLDDARVTEISEAEVLRDAYGGGAGLFGKVRVLRAWRKFLSLFGCWDVVLSSGGKTRCLVAGTLVA